MGYSHYQCSRHGKTSKQVLHLVRQQTMAGAQSQRTLGIPCTALAPEKLATCRHSRGRTSSPPTVFPASPGALHGCGTSSAVSTFQHMRKFHFSLRLGLGDGLPHFTHSSSEQGHVYSSAWFFYPSYTGTQNQRLSTHPPMHPWAPRLKPVLLSLSQPCRRIEPLAFSSNRAVCFLFLGFLVH